MGEPKEHAVLVIDAGAGGWEGDLCDLGAVSFVVENGGNSLLDLNVGSAGPTAVVNVFTQENVRSFAVGPWNELHVLPGNFLQITAVTENEDTSDRDQQVFFGRITEVQAVADSPNAHGDIGWERSWTVRATNLAVDLGEHKISGSGDLTPFESVTARCDRILNRAGSWWPAAPVFLSEASARPSVIDQVATVNLADFAGSVADELDRTVASTWSWHAWVRDPWRWGYDSTYRAALRIVARDSNWVPAELNPDDTAPFRYAAIGAGHYFEEYEACPLPGWNHALDNDNYLYGVHVNPTAGLAFLGAVPYDITGDDTFGSREQTFEGWIGSRTGHGAPESGGSPPSGAGDAGWVVATAWADSTSIERFSVRSVKWAMTDNQANNGKKLDVDRLDQIPVVQSGDVLPCRVKSVRITAAPGDWRVECEVERVDWVTTWDVADFIFE